MSRMSELDQVIKDLRGCADTLIGIASCLECLPDGDGQDEVPFEEKTEAAADYRPEAPPEPAPAGPPPDEETAGAAAEAALPSAETGSSPATEPAKPALRLEDVRAILAECSRSGRTAEVRALLAKYGAKKLSAVNPADYEALLRDAEGLHHAG